jgi:hypothetical protein
LNPVTVEGRWKAALHGFAEALMETQVFKPAAPHHGAGSITAVAARLPHSDLARHAAS